MFFVCLKTFFDNKFSYTFVGLMSVGLLLVQVFCQCRSFKCRSFVSVGPLSCRSFVSVGLLSVGLLSVGLLSVGLLSVGLLKQHPSVCLSNLENSAPRYIQDRRLIFGKKYHTNVPLVASKALILLWNYSIPATYNPTHMQLRYFKSLF